MRPALLCGTAVALICAAPAFAQDANDSRAAIPTTAQNADQNVPPSGTTGETAAVDSAPAEGLNEITVTAQRREESLQRAAVPVDVLTGDTLVSSGLTTSGQLSRLVPSLAVQNNGGANTTFFVRGVGNFTVNGYSDPAVAFNYDGVYLGRPTSTSGMFYDLARIEVLKGPQGTLYGRNATAGAINVIPARPKLGDFSGFASASYGNYDALNLQGALNVPLGKVAAIRVAGNLVSRDGYLSDGMSDEKTQAARAQLLVEPTTDLTIRLAGDYSHQGGKGVGATYVNNFRYNPVAGQYVVTNTGFDNSVGLYDPRAVAFRSTVFAGLPGRTLGPLSTNVYQDNTFTGVNAEITLRTGAGTLTVIPAARWSDLDNRFPTPAFIGYIQEKDRQYSVEARFAGERVAIFDYILGAYFFDERVRGNYTFSQDALAAYQEFVSDTTSYAAFARVTAHLTDRFRLVGGIRYTQDDKGFDGTADVITVVCTARNAFGIPNCPNSPVIPVTDNISELTFPVPAVNGPPVPLIGTGAIVTRATTPVDRTLSADRITYRLAAEFDVAPSSLLYASFETGYRSGGFSLSFGKETFEPEYIDAWTIGSKNRFFGNRLQLNLEAFLWKYRNQQVNHSGIDLRGNQGQFTENVGSSTNKGFEVEVQALATRNTLLSAQVQYLDAKYDDFVYTAPLGNAPPYVGCPVSINPTNAAQRLINCSGFPAYNAPKWTINLGAQQTIPLGDYQIVAQADTQYKSSRVVGFEYAPYQIVGPSWTSNAQISFGPANDHWSLTGFVRNIEDDRVVTAAPVYNIGGIGTVVTTAPRTYGVRANVRF